MPFQSSTSLHAYGKGSEIWPECNEEPVVLATSFPGGVVPRAALNMLELSATAAGDDTTTVATPSSTTATINTADETVTEGEAIPTITTSTASTLPSKISGRKRRAIKQTLSHLLQSAAQASSQRAATASNAQYSQTYGVPSSPSIDKGPAVVAVALVALNCVGVRDAMSAGMLTMYLIALASWCAAPKSSSSNSSAVGGASLVVNMPSLPSKGHVPNIVANPLGASLTNSSLYRTWLRLGALLGLLLPMLSLALLSLGSKYREGDVLGFFVGNSAGELVLGEVLETATSLSYMMHLGIVKRVLGGPMFLLCCQALTEAVARTAMVSMDMLCRRRFVLVCKQRHRN